MTEALVRGEGKM